MDIAAALERYRQEFFAKYKPIAVRNLAPGMKIVIPDDPQDYGGGPVFMEVTDVVDYHPGLTTIKGRLTQAHSECGAAGSDVVAGCPFDSVGLQ